MAIPQKPILPIRVVCQSLNIRLILNTTIYWGQADFRVGGDYMPVNEDI